MRKLLLLSVVLATIGFPLLAARDRSPARSLKRLLIVIIGFNLFYLLAVRFLYPHLS
jgi:hypothetical protein